MKAVLISIKPKWCELIANGKKTVEVRKTKPKIDVPFKCYIYCTSNKDGVKDLLEIHDSLGKIHKANRKVIGEFVCNYILPFRPKALLGDSEIVRKSCVKVSELIEYAPNKPFPNDHIYAWHITDLVIYDKPKELGEFYNPDKVTKGQCVNCVFNDGHGNFNGCNGSNCYENTRLKRPPQSWCYVEELGV